MKNNSETVCNRTDQLNDNDYNKMVKACANFFSAGRDIREAGISGDVFSLETIGERKFFIRSKVGKKDQQEYYEYLVTHKHLHRINRIDHIGDVTQSASSYLFDAATGTILVKVKAIPAKIQDNIFIEDYLASVFGEYKSFIKEWMAVYVYSNYKKLPTLILTGERGVGKNTFAEAIQTIYPSLSETARDIQGNFNPFAEKKLLIIDESTSSGKLQYQMLKKFSGQQYLEVHKKYLNPYQVQNNLNIIVLSNDELPIFVERDEIPSDEKNNQFFVFRMKPQGKYDADLHKKLAERMGYFIRTELKNIYNSLNLQGYRYSIRVPITEEEKKLFQDSLTDVDIMTERIIDYISDTIDNPNNPGYKFLKEGLLPSRIIDSIIAVKRVSKQQVVYKLQKLAYLTNDKSDKYKMIEGERPLCYKLGSKSLQMLEASNTPPVNKLPIHTLSNRQFNGQIYPKTGTEGA